MEEGEEFTIIEPRHIPKDSIIFPFLTDVYNVDELKSKFYFTYKRGRFIAVDKTRCEVPKIIGRKYNF